MGALMAESHRFEFWAGIAPINDGFRMLMLQQANEVLRHCRIGRVTKRPVAPLIDLSSYARVDVPTRYSTEGWVR